jgi:radical SAM-linked protein
VRGDAGFPVRLMYTKQGKVRWISHRDVARAMERAFRITQLPLAFSAGFSPRPKVSFGLALSTGHESDAEYLDLEFAHEVDCDPLPATLSAALPEGIDVVRAVPLVERAPALQEAVTAVGWRLELGSETGELDANAVVRRVDAALATAAWPTMRRRKGREVTEDVRPVVRHLELEPTPVGEPVTMIMELSTQPRSAKPREILAAIAHAAEAPDDIVEVRARRTEQWIERDGARLQPHFADTRTRAQEVRAS